MKKVFTFFMTLFISNLALAGNCKPEGATSIQDIATGNPDFSYLVAAVAKADLLGFLDGNRQFTVFAPTNDAFDAAAKLVLDEDTAEGPDLLAILSSEATQEILKYHIAPGERDATDVLGSTQVRMLNMQFTYPSQEGSVAFINEAQILSPNNFACNGVVHVIDSVLLPASDE